MEALQPRDPLADAHLLALVVGGGSGTRFGAAQPKQFLPLGGVPVFVHTVRRFLALTPAVRVQLVLPQAHLDAGYTLLQTHLAAAELARVQVTAGGASRTLSVRAGLSALADWLPQPAHPHALVAVQDAVRPFATPEMLLESYRSAQLNGSGVCAVPSKSSLRRRTDGGSVAVDRSAYFAVQTPQTFGFEPLLQAYRNPPWGEFTDDASLMEAAGHPIHLVMGAYDNIKITTPEDMLLAELLLQQRIAQVPGE